MESPPLQVAIPRIQTRSRRGAYTVDPAQSYTNVDTVSNALNYNGDRHYAMIAASGVQECIVNEVNIRSRADSEVDTRTEVEVGIQYDVDRHTTRVPATETVEKVCQLAQSAPQEPSISTRYLGFTLNTAKALSRKKDACSRAHVEVLTSDYINFTINLSTAAFELFRNALHNATHTQPDRKAKNTRPNRNITHVINRDDNNLIVSESLEINKWSAIANATLSGYTGNCKIVIHLYTTTSRCLVNGRQAKEFICLFLPLMSEHFEKYSSDYDLQNMQIQGALKELRRQPVSPNKPSIQKKKAKAIKMSAKQNTLPPPHDTASKELATTANKELVTTPANKELLKPQTPEAESSNSSAPPAVAQHNVWADTSSTGSTGTRPPKLMLQAPQPMATQSAPTRHITPTSPTAPAIDTLQHSPQMDTTSAARVHRQPAPPQQLPASNAQTQATLAVALMQSPHSHGNTPICPACSEPAGNLSVICDLCQQWFHNACENLTSDDVRNNVLNKAYNCRSCTVISTTQLLPSHLPNAAVDLSQQSPNSAGDLPMNQRSAPQEVVSQLIRYQRKSSNTAGTQGSMDQPGQQSPRDPTSTLQSTTTARHAEKERQLDDREKVLKAKERSLSRLEQTLKKQQLAQTEISLQNAGMIAQVSKLEEKIKAQQGEIHDLNIRLLANSRPSSNTNTQRVPDQAPVSDPNTLTLILSMLVPLLTAPPRNAPDQLLQPIHTLANTVACLSNAVNGLTGRIGLLEASHSSHQNNSGHQNYSPHHSQYYQQHQSYHHRGSRRQRAKHYSYHDAQDYSPKTYDYNHSVHPTNPQVPSEDDSTVTVTHTGTRQGSQATAGSATTHEPTETALPHKQHTGTDLLSSTDARHPQSLSTTPCIQTEAPVYNAHGTPLPSAHASTETTGSNSDSPKNHQHGSKQSSRSHQEELHFLENPCLANRPPPLGLGLLM